MCFTAVRLIGCLLLALPCCVNNLQLLLLCSSAVVSLPSHVASLCHLFWHPASQRLGLGALGEG